MPEFKIRVQFDVEVEDPSHIDAAFEAARQLQDWADGGRLNYLVYEVASHVDLKDGRGTQYETVDLEAIQYQSDEEILDRARSRWHVYVESRLPDGRRAAWPLVVKKGDEYHRGASGGIIRYADADAAQGVADSLNIHERNV